VSDWISGGNRHRRRQPPEATPAAASDDVRARVARAGAASGAPGGPRAQPLQAEAILALQRSAGNAAVARMVRATARTGDQPASLQRWIRIGPHEIREVPDDFDARFRTWLGRKKIPVETRQLILERAKAWINDAEEHPRAGGLPWQGYAQLFDAIRDGLGRPVVSVVPTVPLELLPPAPWSPVSQPMDMDALAEEEGELTEAEKVAETSSAMREDEPELVEMGEGVAEEEEGIAEEEEGVAEEEATAEKVVVKGRGKRPTKKVRIVHRLRRRGSFSGASGVKKRKHKYADVFERARPGYEPTFVRHRRDKAGTQTRVTEPRSFATVQYDIQGGTSHRLVPSGGGAAPPYGTLFDRLSGALSTYTDQQLGQLLFAILASGTMPDESCPAGAWAALVEIFAVVALSEMPRATFAPLCFLAAANEVAAGRSRLKAAFVGTEAIYLGAGKGGAAALRGTIDMLRNPTQLRLMTAQQERAAVALAALLSPYVSGASSPEERDARLEDLAQRVLVNMRRLEVAAAEQLKARPEEAETSGSPSKRSMPEWLVRMAARGSSMPRPSSGSPTSLSEALALYGITAESADGSGNLCAINAIRKQLTLHSVAGLPDSDDTVRAEAGFPSGEMIDLVAQGPTLAGTIQGHIHRPLRVDVVVWTGDELVLVQNVIAPVGHGEPVHIRLVLDQDGEHFHSITHWL
jgi:hypothetical protein